MELLSTYLVNVSLVDINISVRVDWRIKKLQKMPLKIKRPLGDVPQGYELIVVKNFDI